MRDNDGDRGAAFAPAAEFVVEAGRALRSRADIVLI